MTTAPITPQLTPLEARTAEVAQYQANIVMYSAMLAALPKVYPAYLEKYKGATDKHAVIGTIEDLADVALLADLWAGDDAAKAIRTETLEMRKAQAILAVMQSK